MGDLAIVQFNQKYRNVFNESLKDRGLETKVSMMTKEATLEDIYNIMSNIMSKKSH